MAKANKIVRNGKNLIVVLGSTGEILNHSACTDEMYNKLVNADTDEEIREVIEPKKAEVVNKVIKEIREAEDLEQSLRSSKILTLFHSSIYWKAVCEVSLPRDFAMSVLTAEKEGNTELLHSYKNFWVLCSLNPDSRARNNLFWFLKRYGFTISKNGLFVAYRNVELKTRPTITKVKKVVKKTVEKEVEVDVEEEVEIGKTHMSQDNSLNAFISSEFTRVRFKLKKSPKNFFVGKVTSEDGIETYVSNAKEEKVGKKIGILSELYEGLMNAKPEDVIRKESEKAKAKTKDVKKVTEEIEEEIEVVEEVQTSAVYTDSKTGKMSIMIGQTVSISRADCDPDQDQTCSRGLHVAGMSWLQSNYFGKVSLVVLVNPADVVAVPPQDGYGKMRTCAYFPLAVIDRDKSGSIINPEFENGFDDDFIKVVIDGYTVNNNDDVKNYTMVAPSVYEFNPKTITKNLEEIRKTLAKKTT